VGEENAERAERQIDVVVDAELAAPPPISALQGNQPLQARRDEWIVLGHPALVESGQRVGDAIR
jgi:hypothetical protein